MEGNSKSVSCEFYNDILGGGWILHCGRDGVFTLALINCQSQRHRFGPALSRSSYLHALMFLYQWKKRHSCWSRFVFKNRNYWVEIINLICFVLSWSAHRPSSILRALLSPIHSCISQKRRIRLVSVSSAQFYLTLTYRLAAAGSQPWQHSTA